MAGQWERQITVTHEVSDILLQRRSSTISNTYWFLLMYEQSAEFVFRPSPVEESHWHLSNDCILLDDLAKRGWPALHGERDKDPSENLSNTAHIVEDWPPQCIATHSVINGHYQKFSSKLGLFTYGVPRFFFLWCIFRKVLWPVQQAFAEISYWI